ncbi:TerD family protein, partial [Streptomyces alkaliphilus]|uniref:TerD family protein n=1 Tax=Streptomyces alkaliphilus TaxID=1472722 RepID=UPI0018876D6B
MVKGANTVLTGAGGDGPVGPLIAEVSHAGAPEDLDAHVLLLTADGRVRGDADLVFHNNPASADGSVRLAGKTGKGPGGTGCAERVRFEPAAVPAEVERIVLAAARCDGGRFGDLKDLTLTLSAVDGAGARGVPLRFAVTDAGPESALILGELYRRGTGWKFRAVGQGYDTGLVGLVTDFGIVVEEEPGAPTPAGPEPAAAEPTAPHPSAPAPGPSGTGAPTAPPPVAPPV